MVSRRSTLAAVIVMALAFTVSATAAEKRGLYRWVDANGQVHYGDKIPPQDARQGRAKINKQGLVTKVVPRELSPAERAAANADAKARQDAAEQRARQVAYDRFLVQANGSVADIQVARDARLAAIDGRAQIVQKGVISTEHTLGELRKQTGGAELAKQIAEYEQSLINNLKASSDLRQERSDTEARFAHDIDRYKRLKSGSLQPGD